MQRQSKSSHPWWLDIGFRAFVVYVWYSLLTLIGINVKNRHIPIRMKGFGHPFYARFGSSDIGVFNQIFSEQEYSCLTDVADPKLIIDCGSNVGYSSLWYLQRYPQAKIICVEPDEGNITLCKKNLAPYSDRVNLVKAGIWPREAGLVVERGDGLEWAFQVRESRSGESPDLYGADIFNLLSKSGFDKIDILKIDIETAEKALFSSPGYERWLDKTKNLVIELHGPDCDKIFFDAMRDYRYDLSTSGELTVCKNISRKPAH